MKQLIFVVESDAKNKSDNRYINKLILERYDLTSNDIKIQFVNMGGKYKYKNTSTTTQINKYIRDNKKGQNFVIYCFDTNRIDCEQNDKNVFTLEQEYFTTNNFHLIWFNYDIEYVLLGKTIESSKKKEESIKYQRKTINIAYNKLSCKNENQKGYSNIFLVLDNLLPLKK